MSQINSPKEKISPTQITAASSLDEILIFARQEKASDVHLSTDKPISLRQFSKLKNITSDSLSAKQTYSLVVSALSPEILKRFETSGDTEYIYTIAGHGRFRMALMKQHDGWDLTARLIPMEIPKFENTNIPPACAKLTKWSQGLVLISGPAGCGKTTTLAVLIEMINQNRSDHIITIEKPIEIIYEPKQCQITQREVNTHTLSQDNALRAALREDPDILVVSELRDLQAVQLAISAAETGHLVFGTMNTVNATQTISRVIDSFPSEEQPIIRKMISESLRGVICQQLIPKKDGSGLVAAYEILIVNPSIANLIREGRINQINNAIATGKTFGMTLMDTSLQHLIADGTVSKEEASQHATNPSMMMQLE